VSRWRDWDDYKATKRPVPADGIKIKKAGSTWWGQQWIEALQQVLRGDAGRLARGRTYARAGRTHDLVVADGKVRAKVTGSRATPYQVELALAQLSSKAWSQAIAAMAAQAQFSAELLAGQMPRQIDALFRAAGSSLFPRQRSELVTSCSCPDWGDPCKHVAATHYVLGEALDRDPFLLFELRGRSKPQVLAALRAARAGEGPMPSSELEGTPLEQAAEPPKVSLGALSAADYDRAREALPTLDFSFAAPATHGALLQQLGAPLAWSAAHSPAEALAPIVQRAAEAARRIALADEQAGAPPEPTPDLPKKRRQKRAAKSSR